jgi:hypothetical protein
VGRFGWFFLFAASVFVRTGIAPRPASTDYLAHETSGGITVAARALAPDQARKVLPPELKLWLP